MSLSKRGHFSRDFTNIFSAWATSVIANPYHKDNNPKGMINFGIAESSICEDIITEKLNEPTSFTCESWMQYYFDFRGVQSFRESLASFLCERFNSHQPLDPDNIIVTSGAGAAIDLLTHAFLDPSDYIINLAPYYFAIRCDVGVRGLVKCVDIQLPGRNCKPGETAFGITSDLLENGMEKAKREGKNVRAILVINPNNPTGGVYTVDEIKCILDFAKRHDIHVFMDEIYGLTVFDERARFYSVLSLKEIPCPEKTHFIWGFSKDFCISGFRCGVIHTWNKEFALSVQHLLYMAAVPTLIQHKLKNLIEDKEWLDQIYFPANLERLRKAYQYYKTRLENMGVKVHPGKGTFFIWADMSQLILPLNKESELALFKELYYSAHVYCLPGQFFFYDQPGWFRFTITNSREYNENGLDRLEEVIGRMNQKRFST